MGEILNVLIAISPNTQKEYDKAYIQSLFDSQDHIEFVETLEECIAELRNSCYDIILLSTCIVDSPEADLVRMLKAKLKNPPPIIVLSNHYNKEAADICIQEDVMDYFSFEILKEPGFFQQTVLKTIQRFKEKILLSLYDDCLQLLTKGKDKKHIFDYFNNHVPMLLPGVKSIIMLPDHDHQRLKNLTASEFSKEWMDAIDNKNIHINSRTYGKSAYLKKRLITESIAKDKNWSEKLKKLAAIEEIRSCWADPILKKNNQLQGVILYFFKNERRPTVNENHYLKSINKIASTLIGTIDLTDTKEHVKSKFQAIFDHSTDAIMIHDENFIIVDANQTLFNTYGFERNQIIGQKIGILCDDFYFILNSQMYLNRLKTGNRIQFECEYNSSMGKKYPVNVSIKRVSINDQSFYIHVCKNLSEIKEHEAKLIHSNNIISSLREINRLLLHEKSRYKFIKKVVEILIRNQDYYHVWIVLVDGDGNVTHSYENSRYRERYCLNEQLGGNLDLPSCMQEALKGNTMYCADQPNDRCRSCPVAIQDIDHGAFAKPLTYKGKRFGIMSIGLDPHMSRKVEEQRLFSEIANDVSYALYRYEEEREQFDKNLKFKLLEENSRDCIFLMSVNQRILYVNPAIQQLSGYTEREFVGSYISDHILLSDQNEFHNYFENIIDENVQFHNLEIVLKHKNGSLIPCEFRIKLLKNNDDSVSGIQGIITSIEDKKSAHLKLDDVYDEKTESNDTKSNFLSVMSHEMRTPLNPIIVFSNMMLDSDDLDHEKRSLVEAIHEAALKELRLIDNILNYINIENHKYQVIEKKFDVKKLAHDVVQSLMEFSHGLETRIQYDVPEKLHLVFGPGNLLRQVLTNLVHNAYKYTTEGYVEIKLSVIETVGDGCLFNFMISDTGVGIDNPDHDKLFEPFNQMDTSLSRNDEGVGIGLALCKKIIDLIDGKIDVKSRPNEGSTFSVTVPLRFLED